jgi:hypothetical protein
MKANTKLTSVKVLDGLYKKFKIKSLNEDFTLQKLVNRSIHKFLTDDDYYSSIKKHQELKISGSRF